MSTVPAPADRRRSVGLAVQFGWEGLLLVLMLVTAGLVLGLAESARDTLLIWQVAGLGFVAAGFALSLRTATPNLAVGGFATLAALVYAELSAESWGTAAAGLAAVLAVLVAGVLLGAVTGLTSAPAWATSLVGLAGAQAAMLALTDEQGVVLSTGGQPEAPVGVAWLVLFVLVSVAEGAVFLLPRVRRLLGANRTDGDPARWRPARLVGAVVGLGGSSLLAAVGGIVLVEASRFTATSLDASRLLTAAAAALLGGVSVFGRRGGALGTVFATVILALVTLALAVTDSQGWLWFVVVVVAILIGLAYSRVLEAVAEPA
jgi:ribose transport system permease protein